MPGGSSYTSGSIGNIFYNGTHSEPGNYTIVPVKRTYYYKKLELSIVKQDNFNDTLWNSQSLVTNTNFDYRDDIDFLIKAAFDFLGKSSKKNINLKIKLKDNEIKKLKSL